MEQSLKAHVRRALYAGFRICSISFTIWSNVLLPNKIPGSVSFLQEI
jgi:hypothetical protein